MSRLATSIFVLAAATGAPALAADWGSPEDIYREAYSIEPSDWTELGDDSDGLRPSVPRAYGYALAARGARGTRLPR